MKAAVIGAGAMGRRHVRALRAMGVEIAGIADPRDTARTQAAAETGLDAARCFADARSLLASARADAVIVATTAPSHHQCTLDAARSGARFVVCEKPMASSLLECDEMIDVCASHGVELAVNHPMRFMPQYTALKAAVEAEDMGGWRSLTVVGGNIGFAANATHYIELFRWLAGEPLADVTAWMSAEPTLNPRGSEFEDAAGTLRVTSVSGRRLHLEIGADQGHAIQIVCAGRTGIVLLDDLAGSFRASVRAEDDRGLPTTRYGCAPVEQTWSVPPDDVVTSTRLLMQAFFAGKPVPSGADGRVPIAVLTAAHISHESGNRLIAFGAPVAHPARRFSYA